MGVSLESPHRWWIFSQKLIEMWSEGGDSDGTRRGTDRRLAWSLDYRVKHRPRFWRTLLSSRNLWCFDIYFVRSALVFKFDILWLMKFDRPELIPLAVHDFDLSKGFSVQGMFRYYPDEFPVVGDVKVDGV